jgi:hypothetical protein
MSYVYIIECVGTEWVKVGFAGDPFGRMKTLQTGCPFKLSLLYCQRFPNAEAVEASLHSEMEGHRSPAENEFFHRDHPAIARILGGATSKGSMEDRLRLERQLSLLQKELGLKLKLPQKERNLQYLQDENDRLRALIDEQNRLICEEIIPF